MGVKTPDFREVRATADELADWARRYPRRANHPPYRSECRKCGKRIWHSGVAVGAHRRACPGPARPETSACAACRTGKGRHSCGLSGLQDMLSIGGTR